jgi:hypothetical protein
MAATLLLPAPAHASRALAADATGLTARAGAAARPAGRASSRSSKRVATRRAKRTLSRKALRASGRATHAAGTVSLRGSRAAVSDAYLRAKEDGLAFARTRREIERGARTGEYVALGRSTSTYRLRGVAVPYVRPATRAFVTDFGADYRRACGEPLTVTSAMRPTSVHLANSVQQTVHPTGMAVDLRTPRRGGCRAWMRTALLGLERRGVVNATEEHRPAHFHVVVFRAP